ncbi:cytochrome D1 domain-containing protein [Sphingomonas cavernae]|nr:cytochrome D1 domain-containing protein [Sphingomonas cavernae]
MRRILLALPLLAVCTEGRSETLIIGNKGEDTVSFVTLETGKERARVPTARMPHEVAISPDGTQAAVVAYGGTTIDIFEVSSGERVKRLDISPNARPHGLIWLRDGRLIATTEGSKSVTIADPRNGMVGAIATDQEGSHMVAVSTDGSRAYVANIGSGTVSVLDINARTKIADIAVGGRPEGIALSADGKELWVGDLSAPRVQVVDTATLKPVASVAVDPVAIRVAISPDGKSVVTSNVKAGTLTEIDRVSRKVRRTISVSGSQEAAQVTILFSRDGSRLYAAETGRDQIAEIDMATGKVVRRIAAGKNGDGLAIAP